MRHFLYFRRGSSHTQNWTIDTFVADSYISEEWAPTQKTELLRHLWQILIFQKSEHPHKKLNYWDICDRISAQLHSCCQLLGPDGRRTPCYYKLSIHYFVEWINSAMIFHECKCKIYKVVFDLPWIGHCWCQKEGQLA